MDKENQLCKKFLLSADWDGAIAALPEKDDKLSSEDFANRAYARCFQQTKDHKDGNYSDAIADASKALVKDCLSTRNLCIRAYAYYLNNNYEAAITDCEKIIERTTYTADAGKKEETTEERMKAAEEAVKAAEEVAKAAEEVAKAAKEVFIVDDADTTRAEAKKARAEADTATKAAAGAQEKYCDILRCTAFANELLGMIYTYMDNKLEASKHHKRALLARQTDIELASPTLMDAYRDAYAAIKSIY
ncbi:MAG: hypothetical protein LBL06_04125 [Treponema sp.]|jgi:tetratricopeptide (TPR) repeat protein|nr:hypothetical protein [Treponema sp.]